MSGARNIQQYVAMVACEYARQADRQRELFEELKEFVFQKVIFHRFSAGYVCYCCDRPKQDTWPRFLYKRCPIAICPICALKFLPHSKQNDVNVRYGTTIMSWIKWMKLQKK